MHYLSAAPRIYVMIFASTSSRMKLYKIVKNLINPVNEVFFTALNFTQLTVALCSAYCTEFCQNLSICMESTGINNLGKF